MATTLDIYSENLDLLFVNPYITQPDMLGSAESSGPRTQAKWRISRQKGENRAKKLSDGARVAKTVKTPSTLAPLSEESVGVAETSSKGTVALSEYLAPIPRCWERWARAMGSYLKSDQPEKFLEIYDSMPSEMPFDLLDTIKERARELSESETMLLLPEEPTHITWKRLRDMHPKACFLCLDCAGYHGLGVCRNVWEAYRVDEDNCQVCNGLLPKSEENEQVVKSVVPEITRESTSVESLSVKCNKVVKEVVAVISCQESCGPVATALNPDIESEKSRKSDLTPTKKKKKKLKSKRGAHEEPGSNPIGDGAANEVPSGADGSDKSEKDVVYDFFKMLVNMPRTSAIEGVRVCWDD